MAAFDLASAYARIPDFAHMDRCDLAAAYGDGCGYVILKACTGVDAPDPRFSERFREAHGLGMRAMAYAFGTDQHPGRDQWDDFAGRLAAECAATGQDPTTVPAWLDFERYGAGRLMPLAEALAWLEAGELAGHTVGIYGGDALRAALRGQPDHPIGRYLLWFSQYAPAPTLVPDPWPAPWFWQFSSGKDYGQPFRRDVAGCGRPDLSAFMGPETALRAWYDGSPPSPAI